MPVFKTIPAFAGLYRTESPELYPQVVLKRALSINPAGRLFTFTKKGLLSVVPRKLATPVPLLPASDQDAVVLSCPAIFRLCQAVPVLKKKAFTVVSYTSRPLV